MKFSAKELEVLYLDNHLLAINKPATLLTQATHLDGCSLEVLAKAWLGDKLKKRGNIYLHPIHRLDKPVSGIILFARTGKALSRLHAQVRGRLIKKTYFAQIEGELTPRSGVLKHALIHGDHRAHHSPSGGKEAILSYTVCRVYSTYSSLVKIVPHTGRYHQIRAQLSLIGHPILGDRKYGSKRKSSRIHLHHAQMSFTHPVALDRLTITSVIPFM